MNQTNIVSKFTTLVTHNNNVTKHHSVFGHHLKSSIFIFACPKSMDLHRDMLKVIIWVD